MRLSWKMKFICFLVSVYRTWVTEGVELNDTQLSFISKLLQEEDTTVKGFYHVSPYTPYWKDVVQEQLFIMDGKKIRSSINSTFVSERFSRRLPRLISILDVIQSLHVNIVGNHTNDYYLVKSFIDSLELLHRNKLLFHFNQTLPRGTFSDASHNDKLLWQADSNLSEGNTHEHIIIKLYIP
jgi:hypothetical protein